MTSKQKILVLSAAGLAVIGLAVYGGISLSAKMNQVKELNTQIAEAEQEDKQGEDKPAPKLPTEEAPQQESELAVTDGETGEQAEPESGQDLPEPSPKIDTAVKDTPKPTLAPKPAAHEETLVKPSASDNKAERKQEIDQATTTKMEGLRTSCSAASSSLVEQIKAEIKGNEESAIETIQEKFLNKVFEAEAKCDAEFGQLVEEAKAQYRDAGIDEQSLPDWSAEYEAAKTEARSAALNEIAKAISS